ncbi:MAG: C25 family cysteine peptidase [Nodosilinea sp.]
MISKPWVLVASAEAIARLTPLIEAHQKVGPVRAIAVPSGVSTPKTVWQDAAALLWVDAERRSPRTGLPRWYLPGPGGEKIPVGWLPNAPEHLSTYAQAAASLWQRPPHPGPLALLGGRDDRTQALLDRLETHLAPPLSHCRWSAERIPRGDLLYALGLGLGAALYLGHGFPTGWHSYGGLSHAHLREWQGKPLGALFCLTCHNASRHLSPLSFAETLVLSGRCGAVFAATGQTAHSLNQQLALRLGQAMVDLAATDQPLTLAACLQHPLVVNLPLQRYRILGDPMVPMAGSAGSAALALAVDAPAPHDALPPLDKALWPGGVERRLRASQV